MRFCDEVGARYLRDPTTNSIRVTLSATYRLMAATYRGASDCNSFRKIQGMGALGDGTSTCQGPRQQRPLPRRSFAKRPSYHVAEPVLRRLHITWGGLQGVSHSGRDDSSIRLGAHLHLVFCIAVPSISVSRQREFTMDEFHGVLFGLQSALELPVLYR